MEIIKEEIHEINGNGCNTPIKRKLDQLRETDQKVKVEDVGKRVKQEIKSTKMEEIQQLIDQIPNEIRNHHVTNTQESFKDTKSPIILRVIHDLEGYEESFAWWPVTERVGTLVLNTLYVTLDNSPMVDHTDLLGVVIGSMSHRPDQYEKRTLLEFLGTIVLGKIKKIQLGDAYKHNMCIETFDENTCISIYSLSPRLATYTFYAPNDVQ